MDFKYYFSEQLKMHPSIQHQDAVKLCYQAAFGAEHFLSDYERARAYLQAEYEAVSSTNEPLFEQISPEIVRVNLGAWKREGRNPDTLFEVFKNSVSIKENAKENFISYLEIAEQTMVAQISAFDLDDWHIFLEEYKAAGMPPIHHSSYYREREKPAYRIVKISELENIL